MVGRRDNLKPMSLLLLGPRPQHANSLQAHRMAEGDGRGLIQRQSKISISDEPENGLRLKREYLPPPLCHERGWPETVGCQSPSPTSSSRLITSRPSPGKVREATDTLSSLRVPKPPHAKTICTSTTIMWIRLNEHRNDDFTMLSGPCECFCSPSVF